MPPKRHARTSPEPPSRERPSQRPGTRGSAKPPLRKQSQGSEDEQQPRRGARSRRSVQQPSSRSTAPATRDSAQLARENGISPAQEVDIKDAFSLFAIGHPDFEDSDEGVIKVEDVRRCLISLNLRLSPRDLPEILETLDPTKTGFVPYQPFLSLAALHLQHNEGSDSGSSHTASPSEEDDDAYGPARGSTQTSRTARRSTTGASTVPVNESQIARKGKGKARAVEQDDPMHQAYLLFTHGSSGPITTQHLWRVAREIRAEKDVDENLLQAMILEANGGVGKDGLGDGVGWDDFVSVMERAGVRR